MAAGAEGATRRFHALADVKGRLIAILLTIGEAHDCSVAAFAEPSKRMLGDYDSAKLREGLHERGTKPVIPNRCNRKQPSASANISTSCAGASRARSTGLKDFRCKIWYLISRTVSEDDAHRGSNDDCSVGAFAVKPRAFGAPLCGIGA